MRAWICATRESAEVAGVIAPALAAIASAAMKVIMHANMSGVSRGRQRVAFGTVVRDVNAGTTERRRRSAAPNTMPDHPLMAPNPSSPQELQQHRQRLRFSDFKFHRTPGGRCTAEVELEWIEGIKVRGSASGQSSPTVDLRVAAEAE